MSQTFQYQDGCTISLDSALSVDIKKKEEQYHFDEADKQKFDNGLGESVLEYSGLSVDYNPECSWARANYIPNGTSQLHFHREHTEEYYIIQGQLTVTVDQTEYRLLPGDYLKILANQQHFVCNQTTDSAALIVKCTPAWTADDSNIV
mgnify:CR=1 FL=1